MKASVLRSRSRMDPGTIGQIPVRSGTFRVRSSTFQGGLLTGLFWYVPNLYVFQCALTRYVPVRSFVLSNEKCNACLTNVLQDNPIDYELFGRAHIYTHYQLERSGGQEYGENHTNGLNN